MIDTAKSRNNTEKFIYKIHFNIKIHCRYAQNGNFNDNII